MKRSRNGGVRYEYKRSKNEMVQTGEEEDPVLDIANERTKKNKRMMDSIIPV